VSSWRAAPALRRATLLVVVLVLGGLVVGRLDAVVLAAPLALGLALTVSSGRPTGTPVATASTPRLVIEGASVPVTITVTGLAGAQLVVVRVHTGGPDPGPHTLVVPAERAAAGLGLAVGAMRWGRRLVARADAVALGPDGMFLSGPEQGAEHRATVLPELEALGEIPAPARPAGLVGSHRTRRPGDGSDLHDVREFVAGDRLRRIDWKVTARHGGPTGRIYVRRTLVDADADVVLALDTRMDLGIEVADWSGVRSREATEPGARPGGSLDTAVRAAASLAQTHLRQGDRVAVDELGRPGVLVRSGSGRRHLLLVRLALAGCSVPSSTASVLTRASSVPAGATVYLLSPFIDSEPADLAASLARRGVDVVALDTLPGPLVADAATPGGELGLRLLLAERADRLRGLAGHGVTVLPWDPRAVVPVLRRRRFAGHSTAAGLSR
jgi:uncharacterized protein (DUF58 family)